MEKEMELKKQQQKANLDNVLDDFFNNSDEDN